MDQKDKKIYFRDMGLGCDLVICGKTEEEVISKAGEHVLAMHGIEGFSKEFYNRAQSAIREGNWDDRDAEEMVSEDSSSCDELYFDCADECCC